jgi:hypothetical protein
VTEVPEEEDPLVPEDDSPLEPDEDEPVPLEDEPLEPPESLPHMLPSQPEEDCPLVPEEDDPLVVAVAGAWPKTSAQTAQARTLHGVKLTPCALACQPIPSPAPVFGLPGVAG